MFFFSNIYIFHSLISHVRLLSLADLQALLHELGHAFHFCLSAHKYEELRVMAEDRMEIPSTSLEYLVRDPDFLRHVIEECQVAHWPQVMADLRRKRPEFVRYYFSPLDCCFRWNLKL